MNSLTTFTSSSIPGMSSTQMLNPMSSTVQGMSSTQMLNPMSSTVQGMSSTQMLNTVGSAVQGMSSTQMLNPMSSTLQGMSSTQILNPMSSTVQGMSSTQMLNTVGSAVQGMSSNQILNPSIPYVGAIPGGVKVGTAVFIQGTIPLNANQFAVNWKTGQSDGDDIAFQFLTNFGQNEVILNSRQSGGFGSEEKTKCPFTKGSPIILIITVNSEDYQVQVNGMQLCQFKHRIPIGQVNALNIVGELAVQSIKFMEAVHDGQSVTYTMGAGNVMQLGGFGGTNVMEVGGFGGTKVMGVGGFSGTKVMEVGGFSGTKVMEVGGFSGTNVMELGGIGGTKVMEVGGFSGTNVMELGGFGGTKVMEVGGFGGMKTTTSKVTTFSSSGGMSVHSSGEILNGSTFNAAVTGGTTWKASNLISDVAQPVYDPDIPYMGAVSGGLRAGIALYMMGFIPMNAQKFTINLKTAAPAASDIAFHYNPRFGQKVALNSFRNGSWEKEESISDAMFMRGAPFELAIVVQSEGYQVFVNGQETCKFLHRIPPKSVKVLNICDDISITLFGFIQNWRKTSWFTEFSKTTSQFNWIQATVNSEIGYQIRSPTIPYMSKLAVGLTPGMALYFQGMIPMEADKFAVNLKTGESDSDDIAFHYNPRFGERVALNSFRNGAWEEEQSASDSLFSKGATFEMAIIINLEGYQVFINGQENCKFLHRIALEKVMALEITGSVSIFLYGFIESWSTTTWFTEFSKTISQFSWIQSTISSEIAYEIRRPALPYMSKLAVGLTAGMALYFKGMIPMEADKFAVNLKTGESDSDDIAFHYNPRFGERVALNSFRNGAWEEEQSASDSLFSKGTPFEMAIVINLEGYQVFINGQENCKFLHRIALEKVMALEITGSVSIFLYGFIEALPYMSKLAVGLTAGMALYFKGMIPMEADKFAVNLKTGESDSDDIAFHYNPRFGERVALNSFRNGAWEEEQSASDSLFSKGATFEMAIVISLEGYQVFINGQENCKFLHRIALENVTALEITGSVSIFLYGFIESWTTTTWFTEFSKTISQFSWIQSTISSEIVHEIRRPAMPYMSKLAVGLTAGMALYFKGMIPMEADKFAVNLKTGESDSDDIAFHYNPHFGERVALNSFRNGAWEKEQSASDSLFSKGATFEMAIVISLEGYQVFINGQENCKFLHRIALENVTALEITGSVSIFLYGFIESWTTTTWFTEFSKTISQFSWIQSTISSEIVHEIRRPAMPYMSKLAVGLTAGMALYFKGMIPMEADKFAINLKTGESDSDDIAFHYNPRFGERVALNSFRNGAWEEEQSASDSLFSKGAPFEMAIVISLEGYQVFINGQENCKFLHRIALENVMALEITGSVSIFLYGFIETWSTTTWFTEFSKTISQFSWIQSTISTEIVHEIRRPALPYMSKLAVGLTAGMALYFKGIIPMDADKFAVNLKTGESDSDDIAFHYNPRFGERVALNSFRNGAWEEEQSASDSLFSKGAPFEMAIVIHSVGYQVFINGQENCKFLHRIALENVMALEISGSVSIFLYGFIQSWSTTTWYTEFTKTISQFTWIQSTVSAEITHEIRSLSIPYVSTLAEAVAPGMAFYFQGMIPMDATKFAVNLKTGESDSDDIAFHYNPRFGERVALNSFRNGAWEEEQSASDKVFNKGATFEMAIVFESSGYQVFINGQENCKFQHRMALENVKAIEICGNVFIMLFGFIHEWNTTTWFAEYTKKISQFETFGWTTSTICPSLAYEVRSPSIPYVGQLATALRPGLALCFRGMIPMEATKFEINLKSGESGSDDIAFNYSPCFGEKVVLNSFRNGAWEEEQSASDSLFSKGAHFEMAIVVKSEGYQVFVNGQENCMFLHRIPFEKVSALEICGGVSMMLFGFIQNWSLTTWFTANWSLSSISSEITYKVISPTIPYMGKLCSGLRAGMGFCVHGIIPTEANGFELNLQTGESESNDIALHYNLRFGQGVALNSFRNGSWEEELSASDKPFNKGGAFVMFIIVQLTGYEIYVNGQDNYQFPHRIPLERVKALKISGDVSITSLFGIIQNQITTTEWISNLGRGNWNLSMIGKEITRLLSNPNIPFVDTLVEELKPGMAMCFQGMIPVNATKFEINLKCGKSDADDIALHYCPQFGQGVAVNSFQNGQWEKEESALDKDFTRGTPFEMAIVVQSEGYQVYVDGEENCLFPNRIPVEKVNTLQICGDVYITNFGYISNWNTTIHFLEQSDQISRPWNIFRCVKTSFKSMLSEEKQGSWSLSTINSGIHNAVSNLIIPYVGSFTIDLKAGTAIYFQGMIPTEATRFDINLKTGECETDDIALNYSPNFGQTVAHNGLKNGSCENEEYTCYFNEGAPFELIILAEADGYQVYVNGESNCKFTHHIPLEKVKAVQITGDVFIMLFGFIKSWNSAFLLEKRFSSAPALPLLTPVRSKTFVNPPVPFCTTFPAGLTKERPIYIRGRVLEDATRFDIAFIVGNSIFPLYFEPRMKLGEVVLCSFQGTWGPTERAFGTSNPFEKGQNFLIEIQCDDNGFTVIVNEEHKCEFAHRFQPYQSIEKVWVKHDVELYHVAF